MRKQLQCFIDDSSDVWELVLLPRLTLNLIHYLEYLLLRGRVFAQQVHAVG